MLPAANRGAGKNLCFPDVCKTPPPPGGGHPQPYLNQGAHAIAVPFSPVVKICGLAALHVKSQIPVTTGDEPGIFGPGPKLLGKFVKGNPIVKVDGIPAVNLTTPAKGNASNASGASLVPDAVNVFYTRAGVGEAGGATRVDDVAALVAPLREARPPRGAMVEDGLAWIRVEAFTADVPTLVYTEIQRLTGEGMRALVLDLRGNPGGDLAAAVALAADFLPEGAVVATVIDEGGDEIVYRSRRPPAYLMPLGVLVDGGTASAAEVLAGSLEAHGRALVAGDPTHGKGSAAMVLPALGDEGGAVYATVARVILPGGIAIDGRGVLPDVSLQELMDDEDHR